MGAVRGQARGVAHALTVRHGALRVSASHPAAASRTADERLVFLGDDADGVALEVMAVELQDGSYRVIHSMPLREAYRRKYREVKQWRR